MIVPQHRDTAVTRIQKTHFNTLANDGGNGTFGPEINSRIPRQCSHTVSLSVYTFTKEFHKYSVRYFLACEGHPCAAQPFSALSWPVLQLVAGMPDGKFTLAACQF